MLVGNYNYSVVFYFGYLKSESLCGMSVDWSGIGSYFATALCCEKEKMKRLFLTEIDEKMSFHAKCIDLSNG